MSAPMKRTVDLFYDVISAYSWFSFEVGSHTSSSAVMMIYLTVYGFVYGMTHAGKASSRYIYVSTLNPDTTHFGHTVRSFHVLGQQLDSEAV